MSKEEKDKEYTFINEQILSKRKSRYKKAGFTLGLTLICAVIFGIVARIAFIQFGPWVDRLLGVREAKKNVVLAEDEGDKERDGKDQSSNIGSNQINSVVMQSELTGDLENNDVDYRPTNNETITLPENDKIRNQNQETEKSEDGEETSYVKVQADLEDYVAINEEIRKKISESAHSIVNVISIKEKLDALSNPYQQRNEAPGIIIGSNEVEYFILVPYSEVKEADALCVYLQENTLDANMIDYDADINLAILSIEIEHIPEEKQNNVVIAPVGESFLLSIGSPVYVLGLLNGCNNSGEIGMITNCSRSLYIPDMKLDLLYANFNLRKESTGYVFDLEGNLVGIVMKGLKEEDLDNLYPMLGISRVKSLVEKMMNGIKQVYLGIVPQELSKEELEDMQIQYGVYVSEVKANSPAYEAGIQNGDIVVSMDSKSVAGINSYMNIIGHLTYKTEVNVLIIRYNQDGGKNISFRVKMGDKKDRTTSK